MKIKHSTIKVVLLFFFAFSCFLTNAQNTFTFVFNGDPIANAKVTPPESADPASAQTDNNGRVTFTGLINGTVSFTVDLNGTLYNPTVEFNGADMTIDVVNNQGPGNEVGKKTNFTPSSYSDWAGAEVMFNFFEENDANNLIGPAEIKIDSFIIPSERVKMNLIGTISDIQEDKKEDIQKNIAELAQSNQGFQIGLEPTYLLAPGKNYRFAVVARFSFKYNAFTDSTAEGGEETIGLPQGRVVLGLEYEGLKLASSGRKMLIGIQGFQNVFDAGQYEKLFNSDKNNVLGANFGIIVPMSSFLGFKFSGTYIKDFKPIYSAGIVFSKPSKK